MIGVVEVGGLCLLCLPGPDEEFLATMFAYIASRGLDGDFDAFLFFPRAEQL